MKEKTEKDGKMTIIIPSPGKEISIGDVIKTKKYIDHIIVVNDEGTD